MFKWNKILSEAACGDFYYSLLSGSRRMGKVCVHFLPVPYFMMTKNYPAGGQEEVGTAISRGLGGRGL